MVSRACASVMAWRNEPRPLSAVLVTTIVRPGRGIGTDVGEEVERGISVTVDDGAGDVGRGISVTVDVVGDALPEQPGTSGVSTTAMNSRTARFICSRSRSASMARGILVGESIGASDATYPHYAGRQCGSLEPNCPVPARRDAQIDSDEGLGTAQIRHLDRGPTGGHRP